MKIHRPSHYTAGFICQPEPDDGLPFFELGEVYLGSGVTVDRAQTNAWEICLQVKGESTWSVGDKKYTMSELDSYLIRPGVKTCLQACTADESHFYFVAFPDRWIPEELKPRSEWKQDCLFSENSGELLLPLQNLIREISIPQKWRRYACQLTLQQLCIAFSRIHLTQQEEQKSWLDIHPAAQRAMSLIEARPDYPWRTEELAAMSGVSESHLYGSFREAYGESPFQCFMRLRIEESKRRLSNTDLSVTQIAIDLGFSSSQHFSRIFRQRTGSSPSEFRNEIANNRENWGPCVLIKVGDLDQAG
ncbi:MAG: helix-turn-helix transcriptional regulator [Opitutales bacterium]|nr:helix-turn-helix transcriptional regulator [Opitutales bacterium]